MVRNYRDLLVWQKALALSLFVYEITRAYPKDEVYGLRSQVRRAAVSVVSNIAEGHGRASDRELLRSLAISTGSLCDLETQIEISRALSCLVGETADAALAKCEEVGRMIHGFVNTIRGNHRGKSQ